jgi:dTDP-4-dehydrorhamnose 3,5-epimerase-like enzyme
MTASLRQPWQLRPLRAAHDARGSLVAFERPDDIPFEVQRVYFIYASSPDAERGFHAHRQLRKMAICVTGSCTVTLDDGRLREDLHLAEPDMGLVIDPMVWIEVRDFSPDCVLLMLASAAYADTDYIRDYDEFVRAARSAAG